MVLSSQNYIAKPKSKGIRLSSASSVRLREERKGWDIMGYHGISSMKILHNGDVPLNRSIVRELKLQFSVHFVHQRSIVLAHLSSASLQCGRKQFVLRSPHIWAQFDQVRHFHRAETICLSKSLQLIQYHLLYVRVLIQLLQVVGVLAQRFSQFADVRLVRLHQCDQMVVVRIAMKHDVRHVDAVLQNGLRLCG